MTAASPTPIGERRWRFECPECGFDDEEAGRLATDRVIWCGMCAGDTGRDVKLRKWLAEDKRVPQ